MTKEKLPPITATELMAKLQADPEYQERKRIITEKQQAVARELRLAEQPIVVDLRKAGVDVSSVWDIIESSSPYTESFPVILDHLRRGGYPDRVMESLGRALAVKAAVTIWDELRDLYLQARSAGEEEGLAVALSVAATRNQLEPLIQLLAENHRGSSRILFLRPIRRLGGARGREVLESLRFDPLFGKEIQATLKKR